MTLVERFVEQHSWPASRKTAWLMGIGLPFQVIGTLGMYLTLSRADILDIAALAWLNLCGTGSMLVCWLAGLLAARAGREGRWTAYLSVILFSTYIAFIYHGLGTWSSIFLYWIPMTVLLGALWFDARIATFSLGFQLLLLTGDAVAVKTGLLSYAPLLEERTIDAQAASWWWAGNAAALATGLAATFGMVILAAEARDLQDRRLNLAFTTIRRYVPGQVADALLSSPDHTPEQHERRRLTIFFSDLVGFTDISDEYEPEDLSRLLNEYFTEMTTIAHQYGGTIDELSGDAILVLFGAPQATDDRDHALRAVHMARDMQERLVALNENWRNEGRADHLEVRMGLDTGVVTVGNFGSPERMKYAALGRHVNAAARLQAECPPGRILLTHSTWLLVQDEIECSPNGELTLKGLHKPVETYIVDMLR